MNARDRKYRWLRLPYGCWKTANGRHVMFDRLYRPLISRCPDGRVDEADPTEWVEGITATQHYYGGGDCEADKQRKAHAALQGWGAYPPDHVSRRPELRPRPPLKQTAGIRQVRHLLVVK